MSYLTEDIAQFFIDAEVYQALGTDVFWDKMPDQVDRACAIHEYAGYPDMPYEHDAVHRSIQILCRNTSAKEAKKDADMVYQLIRTCRDETARIDFNGRFTQTTLRQTPFKVSEDSNARVIYGFNLGVTTALDSCEEVA